MAPSRRECGSDNGIDAGSAVDPVFPGIRFARDRDKTDYESGEHEKDTDSGVGAFVGKYRFGRYECGEVGNGDNGRSQEPDDIEQHGSVTAQRVTLSGSIFRHCGDYSDRSRTKEYMAIHWKDGWNQWAILSKKSGRATSRVSAE